MTTHLSQARCAHAYVRAISSSGLRLLALLRDCARRETATLRSSEGMGPLRVGTRPVRACSMGLLILHGREGRCRVSRSREKESWIRARRS